LSGYLTARDPPAKAGSCMGRKLTWVRRLLLA
jgi:hypothetical protein